MYSQICDSEINLEVGTIAQNKPKYNTKLYIRLQLLESSQYM